MSLSIDDSEWEYCQSIEELIQLLCKKIEDKESSIRISATLGLLLIAGSDLFYYERLSAYLKTLLLVDDIYTKGIAALSLGFLGSEQVDPIPIVIMLKILLQDEARFVKWNVSTGLALILSGSVSMPEERRDTFLQELLSSSYWYFRVPGAIGLGFYCRTANRKTVTNQLKRLLNDSDIDVRIGAVYGLGFIAKKINDTEELTGFFKACLYDYDPAVVFGAQVVLNLLKFPLQTRK
jgi:HEAT repeat protein